MKTNIRCYALFPLIPHLLFMALYLLPSYLFSQFKQVQYGGKIIGEIKISEGLLDTLELEIEDVIKHLESKTRAVQLLEKTYTEGSGFGVSTCRKLVNNKPDYINLIPIKAKATLKSFNGGIYTLEYSVGRTSKQPIISRLETKEALDTHKPYIIEIDRLQRPSGGHWFLRFRPFVPLGIAYLTECDKAFECYDFSTYCDCVD